MTKGMGAATTKIQPMDAETNIRNRIQDIRSITMDRHALYNLINEVLNFVNEQGDTMLKERVLQPAEVSLVAQCLFTSLTTLGEAEHLRFAKIFLQNLLTERLNHTHLY